MTHRPYILIHAWSFKCLFPFAFVFQNPLSSRGRHYLPSKACPRSSSSPSSLPASLSRGWCICGMESANRSLKANNYVYTGKQLPVSPFPHLHASTSYVDLGNAPNYIEGSSGHHRSSSESFLIDEQPDWLEDLLNESDTSFQKGHRRSASDTFADFRHPSGTFNIREESNYENPYTGTLIGSRNLVHHKDSDRIFNETKTSSADQKNRKELKLPEPTKADKQVREEPSISLQDQASAPRTDAKRAKQRNANRSRVRKLQYIAQLERTVQLLQAEGSQVSAELEILEQQNIMLTMANRALKQQLDSLSQAQLIKDLEQEMLEREVGRLQIVNQIQNQEKLELQQEQHQPYQQHLRQW